MFIQGSKMMLDRCVVSYECLWTHLRLSWKLSGVSFVTFWKRIPMVSKIMFIFCLTQWSGKLVRFTSTVHYILQKRLLSWQWNGSFNYHIFQLLGFFCCYIICRWIILWKSVSLLFGRYSFGSWKWTTFNNKSGWTWRDINLQLQKWPCKWHNLSFWM